MSYGVYTRHFKIAKKYCKDDTKAKELLHDVMVRALPKKHTMKDEDFSKYLMTCLVNEALTPYRKKVIKYQYSEEILAEPSCSNYGYNTFETENLIDVITKGLTKSEYTRWKEYAECGAMADLDLGTSSAKECKSYKTSIVTARLKLREAYKRHT
jgi:Sigma-70 region 2